MPLTRPSLRISVVAILSLLVLFIAACSSAGSNDTTPSTPNLGGVGLALAVGRSSSDLRATIETTIGGQSQTLLFDTGSVGITVLSPAVPPPVASLAGDAFQEPFDGGVILSGVVISQPVTVAGIASNGPIMIRLVQSATCGSDASDCAAKDGLSGFRKSIGADGILGAGMWSTGSVYSPLTQLASAVPSAIAVALDATSGSVTLNPQLTTAPIATLQMPAGSPSTLPNGAAAWNNLAVPVCWQIGDAQRTCTATSLDIGASALSFPIGFPGGPTKNVKKLDSGQRISASISDSAAPFLEFTSGEKLGTDLVTVIPGQSSVDSGLQFFREFVVVFSVANGTVNLYPAT